jgi:hypothetical protein
MEAVPFDQRFQQVVEVSLNTFVQNEAVLAGKTAGVLATPQNQVIGLGDDGQVFSSAHAAPLLSPQMSTETAAVVVERDRLLQNKFSRR